MDLKSDEMLLFCNTMRITEGHLAGFKGAVGEAVEFAEQHGPQLMVQTFHRRAADAGLQLPALPRFRVCPRALAAVRPLHSKVMEHCTVEKFEVYGQPSEEVRQGLSQLGESLTTVTPCLVGFVRLPSSE